MADLVKTSKRYDTDLSARGQSCSYIVNRDMSATYSFGCAYRASEHLHSLPLEHRTSGVSSLESTFTPKLSFTHSITLLVCAPQLLLSSYMPLLRIQLSFISILCRSSSALVGNLHCHR